MRSLFTKLIRYLLIISVVPLSSCQTHNPNYSHGSSASNYDGYRATERTTPRNYYSPQKVFPQAETTIQTNMALVVKLHNYYARKQYDAFRYEITNYFKNGNQDALGDLFNEKPGFCLEALSVAIKYKEKYFPLLWDIAYKNESNYKVLNMLESYRKAWNKCPNTFAICMRLYLNNRDVAVIAKEVRKYSVLSEIF